VLWANGGAGGQAESGGDESGAKIHDATSLVDFDGMLPI
jgi:hypothetical protein